MIISFALGDAVSLRCELGLSTVLALGGNIDLVKDKLSCSEIDQNFTITLNPPGLMCFVVLCCVVLCCVVLFCVFNAALFYAVCL